MTDDERSAMDAAANSHSRLGDLAFQQGWEAAREYYGGACDQKFENVLSPGAQVRHDAMIEARLRESLEVPT